MTEAYIPLGPLRLALMDLMGAPDEHLVRIEITDDRVFIRAHGASPKVGLMAIDKVFEIECRDSDPFLLKPVNEYTLEDMKKAERKFLTSIGKDPDKWMITSAPDFDDIPSEFHEETPPDWVPPQLIRTWDECTPEQRRAMKEEVEKVKKDDDSSVERNRDPVSSPDREDP